MQYVGPWFGNRDELIIEKQLFLPCFIVFHVGRFNFSILDHLSWIFHGTTLEKK